MLRVLPKGFHRIRHYGLLARPSCADNIARARELLAVPTPQDHNGDADAVKLSALSPRVRSLAAFGRRPPVNVARLSMAGIRNPAQNPTNAPQQTAP